MLKTLSVGGALASLLVSAAYAHEPHHATYPRSPTTYSVHFASYESVDLAQQGWSEIWKAHRKILTGVQPFIDLRSLAGGQSQYDLYGRGLTKAQAEALCRNLQQRNEYCMVVNF